MSAPQNILNFGVLNNLRAMWRELGAVIAVRRKRFHRAQVYCQQLLQWDPHNVRVHRLLACALLGVGESTRAILQLRHALELEPTALSTLRLMGDTHAAAGNPYTAMEFYLRAKYWLGLARLTHVFLQQRDFAKAHDCVQTLSSHPRRWRELLGQAGVAQMEAGHLDNALAALRKARRRDKLLILAQKFFDNHRYAQALDSLIAAKQPAREQRKQLFWWGEILENRGQCHEATLFYVQGKWHQHLCRLGQALILQGHYDTALQCFIQANEIHRDPLYVRHIELTYVKLGQLAL